MNKIFIGIGAFVIVVLSIAVLSKNLLNKHATQNTPAAGAVLTVLQPEVFIKNGGQGEFSEIKQRADVAQGNEIKTGVSGRARLTYANGTSTTIEENTDLILQTLSTAGSQSGIRLVSGGIWSKIKNILGTGDFYEVESETMVASVRGTIFASEIINNIMVFYGIENSVTVQTVDPETGQKSATNKVIIAGGEKVSADRRNPGKLIKKLFDPADFKRPLIERNLLELNESELNDQLRALLKRLLTPSPTPKINATLIPVPSISLLPSPTLLPSISATPTPATNTGSSSTTATPTPSIIPVLTSVVPSNISAGQSFYVNGDHLIAGRNISQISSFYIGNTQLTAGCGYTGTSCFYVQDVQTIFVQSGVSIQPGKYDIVAHTVTGDTLTLPNALTVQ